MSVTTDPITTAVSTDPLSLLTPTERRWYRVADALARRWPWVSILWNQLFMVNVVRLLAMRRITVTGLEHLEKFGPDARLVLADYPDMRAAVQDVKLFSSSAFKNAQLDLSIRIARGGQVD